MPPCAHGTDAHSLMSVWHSTPLYPGSHKHSNQSSSSTHVPLFWHGTELHSFTSVSHSTPDQPATHTHCCFGGMLGNNACGAHAQMAGKAVDKSSSWEAQKRERNRIAALPAKRDKVLLKTALRHVLTTRDGIQSGDGHASGQFIPTDFY